ncbi:MAG: phosphomannomutase/phosphoglucomutase [Rhodospirillaceae bacterium]|nr:phosphomannomutase/phosphoglucomutase [Rhodospirillaceae bacterium]MCA8931015.1 phosphomannomutase/phosphoglucomutase [Rhodospirillaceae bacterium]
MTTFDPSILRAYDIRGIVGKSLSEPVVEAIGRAFASRVIEEGGDTVCVGYDGRLSSPSFAEMLAAGLNGAGAEVLDIGLGPTPMLYFAERTLGAQAGVMITGSHNPPEYNGLKLLIGGAALYGDAIKNIGQRISMGELWTGAGRRRSVPVADDYVRRLVADYDGTRPLKVAWDAGNGAVGAILRQLTDALPGTHHLLFEEVDGTFPNHHPDPTLPETLGALIDTVRREGCDLGIGFDGDGDRIGVVDHEGRIVWADQLLALFAADVLRERPGATVIADVKTSQTLFDEVARLGGRPVMWKTGHSLIKAKMTETGALLAGEMSGHICFADKYYGYDDAPYAAVRLLGLLGRSEGSLADMVAALPAALATPETRFQVDEARKFAVVDEIAARLEAEGADVVDIDGVRVNTPNGWWLIRASNTQDVLVARAESTTEEGLKRLTDQIVTALNASGVKAPRFESTG